MAENSQAIQSHSAPNGGSRAKSKFHEQFEMMPTKAGKTTGVVHGASASGNHGGENFMPQSSFQRSNSVYPYRLDQMQGENARLLDLMVPPHGAESANASGPSTAAGNPSTTAASTDEQERETEMTDISLAEDGDLKDRGDPKQGTLNHGNKNMRLEGSLAVGQPPPIMSEHHRQGAIPPECYSPQMVMDPEEEHNIAADTPAEEGAVAAPQSNSNSKSCTDLFMGIFNLLICPLTYPLSLERKTKKNIVGFITVGAVPLIIGLMARFGKTAGEIGTAVLGDIALGTFIYLALKPEEECPGEREQVRLLAAQEAGEAGDL